ncbi:Uncharacterised protein [Mycobacteroides abscessus subsp. abscessus]|nr:Uncharacterised protein [Mycobacteroides abscessus subsp. abscessus]SLC38228.1 Uncharacterised protein [Mycobacteroides abscessus subsp. abscessus]SLE42594.1 Uncharacterised protein [Mycobacteroides abscessus subsp. abscessus]
MPGTPHFLRLTVKTWLSMSWDNLCTDIAGVHIHKIAYNRKEAADALGISVHRLDELKRMGELAPRYCGSTPLYDPEDLRSFYKSLPSEPRTRY